MTLDSLKDVSVQDTEPLMLLSPNSIYYISLVIANKTKIIRIHHKFVDRIDNSVPRVTVLHHEALPSDAKQWPEGQNCLSYPQTHVGFFFLHTFGC